MTTPDRIWIVLAFSGPPPSYHFVRAKSGKCWVRTISGEKKWAIELGRQLAEHGIHGRIRKGPLILKKSPPRPDAYKVGRSRPARSPPTQYPYPEALKEAARLDGRA